MENANETQWNTKSRCFNLPRVAAKSPFVRRAHVPDELVKCQR
jgi:hypothetical protein